MTGCLKKGGTGGEGEAERKCTTPLSNILDITPIPRQKPDNLRVPEDGSTQVVSRIAEGFYVRLTTNKQDPHTGKGRVGRKPTLKSPKIHLQSKISGHWRGGCGVGVGGGGVWGWGSQSQENERNEQTPGLFREGSLIFQSGVAEKD